MGAGTQQWPTNGKIGYITPGVLVVPSSSQQGTKKTVAHKWANGLNSACCLGGPQRFRAGDKISSGPQVGMVAT